MSNLTTEGPYLSKLENTFGSSVVLNWCSLRDGGEDYLAYFMEKKPISVALEIGTYRGIASSYMAGFCEKLYTIDIHDHQEKYGIWKALGINNIEFIKVSNDEEKARVIKGLNFDFAFIDGNHNTVTPDIESCKKCGHLLFHDYDDRWGVKRDVDAFTDDLEIKDIFAYWEKKQ